MFISNNKVIIKWYTILILGNITIKSIYMYNETNNDDVTIITAITNMIKIFKSHTFIAIIKCII